MQKPAQLPILLPLGFLTVATAICPPPKDPLLDIKEAILIMLVLLLGLVVSELGFRSSGFRDVKGLGCIQGLGFRIRVQGC